MHSLVARARSNPPGPALLNTLKPAAPSLQLNLSIFSFFLAGAVWWCRRTCTLLGDALALLAIQCLTRCTTLQLGCAVVLKSRRLLPVNMPSLESLHYDVPLNTVAFSCPRSITTAQDHYTGPDLNLRCTIAHGYLNKAPGFCTGAGYTGTCRTFPVVLGEFGTQLTDPRDLIMMPQVGTELKTWPLLRSFPYGVRPGWRYLLACGRAPWQCLVLSAGCWLRRAC